jgi:hypothetical protein
MDQTNSISCSPLSFQISLEKIREKITRQPLSDDEILILCAETVARSFSYDEKGYA